MVIREATVGDIAQLHVVRTSVVENRLSSPDLITHDDYRMFLTQYGKGWLAEVDKTVVGFAIIDLLGNNIWALFVHPDFEKRGIGKTLHDAMLNWYFEQTAVAIWLSTTPQTRAEQFYRQAGWTAAGLTRTGEVRFELTREAWVSLNHVVK